MVFRTTNPAQYDEVDGIVIAETAPPPAVQGVPTNVVLLLGQFERGPTDVRQPSSSPAFFDLYGRTNAPGNLSLRNKRFGLLKIKRVVASDAAAASLDIIGQDSGAGAVVRIKAKGKGDYGNDIEVTTVAGSPGTTYQFSDKGPNARLPDEVYENVVLTEITAQTFALSKLIDFEVLDAESGEPIVTTDEPLTGGSDGTIADTDYEDALAEVEESEICNAVFLDEYTANRRQYLQQHQAATQDRMVILANEQVFSDADTAATAMLADVASYRDTQGRIIYCVNDGQTLVDGELVYTNPASWMASVLSQTPAHVDPAAARTKQYLLGLTDVRYKFTRQHFIDFNKAGICALEQKRGEFKFRSGVVTQIANSSKRTILRRRMADFLTTSIGRFLENWQNEPNRKEDRDDQAAAILSFVEGLERDGILPKDSEVQGGQAKIVDANILNTDELVAAGQNRILYRQRIYSAQRFIVLEAEIGESVVVRDVG